MQVVFIETVEFTRWIDEYLSEGDYAQLQHELLAEPQKGVVIPGTGGLRKLRVVDSRRGKGKRGGSRLIYLYVPEAAWIFMIDIYDKDEKDDLAPAERRTLRELVHDFKIEAKEAAKRWDRREN